MPPWNRASKRRSECRPMPKSVTASGWATHCSRLVRCAANPWLTSALWTALGILCSRPVRLPFAQEGLDALFEIVGQVGQQQRIVGALWGELVSKTPDGLFGGLQRQRRVGGHLQRQLLGSRQERLLGRDDLAHEAAGQQLL